MAGLYSHTVFGDLSEPVVTQLQPGLRTKIAEFSREAAQLARQERPRAIVEAEQRVQKVIAAARQDGFQAGRSSGWVRGFLHGTLTALVAFVLVSITLGDMQRLLAPAVIEAPAPEPAPTPAAPVVISPTSFGEDAETVQTRNGTLTREGGVIRHSLRG